ncbi:MAG: hypothetical protein ACI9OJ_001705 [Myxococcota bacterium]|jgi:hypothetical protein
MLMASAVSFAAVFVGACSTASTTGSGAPLMSALTPERGSDGTLVERLDLNGDGTPNLWRIYTVEVRDDGQPGKKVLIRKDIDMNRDGRLDVRQHIGADERIEREEMDLDYDGRVDAVVYYKDGKVMKRELDLTLDGRPDVVKIYENGELITKERDTDDNGTFDVWEYYQGGKLVRIGRDRDGDGKPELFDDAPDQEGDPDDEDSESGDAGDEETVD